MTRKVIIDCDPGIDAAVALAMALFHPELDVVAVTAVAGVASAAQSSRNVQALLERLDPPRYPRLGTAMDPDDGPVVDGRELHGDDGLGNVGFPVSQLHHQHASDKLIFDEVRAAPDEITIICLGPLTNLARAFKRDPDLPALINRLVICGGSFNGGGNITPAAEFNMYFDALSARSVLRAPITKLLVPLEVTRRARFTLDFIDKLPADTTRVGSVLRQVLPFLFRSHHQILGRESIWLDDVVAIAAVLQPELFHTEDMAGDVEVRGELTLGATVFDRRPKPQWRNNMEVATRGYTEDIIEFIAENLQRAGYETR